MSKWYMPYLEIYGRKRSTVTESFVQQIRDRLNLFDQTNPTLSVIAIAYNEDRHLLACLWSLSEQQCTASMELIVVNNNSSDDTEALLKQLGVNYYNEARQGPGFARQCGLDHAKGEYVICIDADTLYPPLYVETHFQKLKRTGISCAFSLWSFLPKVGQSTFSLLLYEFLRDCYLMLQSIKRPELCVRGMVFSFRTDLGRAVGFRTDIRRGEDGSMALGLKRFGKIAFIRSCRARAVTGQSTIGTDGSLFDSFKVRLRKAIHSIGGLFLRKEVYKDDDSNIICKSVR